MAIEINRPVVRAQSAVKSSSGSSLKNLLNKDIQLRKPGFSEKKKERFYSELYVLFSSGIDIRSALELIEEGQKENDKAMFAEIRNRVIAGDSLSASLEKTGKFSPYEYFSIKIG